ncbi:MAG: hypothetical protein ABI461_12105 [Polyangiaceae bacterium]
MPVSSSRPPPPFEEPAAPPISWVLRFGSLVGIALLASVVASAPAAFRLWAMPETSGAWLAIAALEIVPLMIAIAVFRRTRGGLRSFAGERAPEVSLTAAVWLLASVLLLSLIGAVLRATTHNHPLAGVAYAIAATLAELALIPASARLVEIALGWLQVGAKTRLFFALILAGTCVALVALRLVHALPAEAKLSAAASATVVDLCAFALAAILASRPEIATRRGLALVGPPAAVVLFGLGFHQITSSSALATAIVDHGPIFTAAVDLITRR